MKLLKERRRLPFAIVLFFLVALPLMILPSCAAIDQAAEDGPWEGSLEGNTAAVNGSTENLLSMGTSEELPNELPETSDGPTVANETPAIKVGGNKGYYLFHCNIDGAEVSFDEKVKGVITNGTLLVQVYLTATPYHNYSVSKEGYITVDGSLRPYPAKDQTKDINVTLTLSPYPDANSTRPSYPDAIRTRPPYPDAIRTRPPYPDAIRTRPPYPEVTRIQPAYYTFGVYQFDVSDGTKTVGKLTVNTNGKTPTYVFNGEGTAGASYILCYLANTLEGKTVDSAVADATGAVHMQGTWTNPVSDLQETPSFWLAQPGANSIGEPIQSALSLTASPSRGEYWAGEYPWTVTLTATLTLYGDDGPTHPNGVHIYLLTDDGQTLNGTTGANGQCTWTWTMPSYYDVRAHTYTVKYDGLQVVPPSFPIPIVVLPSQGSATFANPWYVHAISLKNEGWFVCRFYVDTVGTRWSPDITKGQTKCIDCAGLGVDSPLCTWGACWWLGPGHMNVYVYLGEDASMPTPFIWDCDSPNVAHYSISGTTLDNTLTFKGVWIGC